MPDHRWQKRSGGTRPDSHFLAAHALSASWPTGWLCFPTRCLTARRGRAAHSVPSHSLLCPKCHSNSRELHGKVVWTRESSHANPGTDFLLCAGSDYRSRHSRGRLFVLLGFPTAAALDVERDGQALDSVLAVA